MRIAVFGATGKAGGAIAREALARGHQVRALVRTPSKLDLRHPELEVILGGFEDADAVRRTLEGADAAVTSIGITSKARPTLLVDSVTAIRAGMQNAGIRRLVVVQGAHLPFPGDPRNPGLLTLKAILGVVMRPLVRDGHRLVTLLMDDDCEWTVIRMPMLKVAPATSDVKVGRLHVSPLKHVTTGDVAQLALRCLAAGSYLQEMPMIISGRAPSREAEAPRASVGTR